MIHLKLVCDFLEQFAPSRLAEPWDNVGLLVGDSSRPVRRLMTCLTVTPASVAEAVAEQVELIVTHHPFPFHAVKRITSETTAGRLLLDLIAAGIAVYSPHTALDSARLGINQRLAEGLGLQGIQPLSPIADDPQQLGAGRMGTLPAAVPLDEFASRLTSFLQIAGLHRVGRGDRPIERVAVACGSGGSFLTATLEHRCQLLITGETSFHTCLEAQAGGVALLLPGHYASERFAVEKLAEVLAEAFPDLTIWPSRRESDPLDWI